MLAAAVCLPLGVVTEAAIPRPNLIPQPQEVRAHHDTVELAEGTVIVCPPRASETLRAALEHIQATVRALGGPQPAVRVAPRSTDVAARPALQIVLGTARDENDVARAVGALRATVSAADPGPQGYVIASGNVDSVPTVLLAGSDDIGALYAAVTFAQMLRRDGPRVVIDAVDVRDWPDFRERIIGRPRGPSDKLVRAADVTAAGKDCASYVATMREAVDFAVGLKINGLTLRSGGTGRWSHVQSFGPAVRAALREVSAYARARGVGLEATAYSAVDVGQGGPAAEVQCVRTHGVGYCWSRDDLLRAQAREFGRFAREAGIARFYLHAPDRTAPGNYAMFGDRCARCRERWRDNQRAAADAHVMALMAAEIRALSPGTTIAAVLVPYGANIDRLPPADRNAVLSYWRDVSAGLPADVAVCVRENRRENVAAFKEAYARQPIYFYIESVMWRGWEPAFATTPRHAMTFDFDDPRDLYFMGNAGDFRALCEGVAAQFAWNSDAPGAALHRSYRHHPLQDGTEPPGVAHALLDQLAARFFGEENGEAIGRAVRGDLSWGFTADPEGMARAAAERLAGRDSDIPGTESIDVAALRDLAALMRHQAEGSADARRALEPVFGRIASARWTPTAWQREQLALLLSYVSSVDALAPVRHALLAATDANRTGDQAAAREFVAAGIAAADAAPRKLRDAAAMIGGEERWYAPARRVAERVAEDRARLVQLQALARGVVPELADSPENLRNALFVFRDRTVTTRSSGNGDAVFTDALARTPGQKVLHFTRPEKRWEGCQVRFDRIDIRPFVAAGGYLRFYVNSDGPKGWHRATFWGVFEGENGQPAEDRIVYLHRPSAEERRRREWPGFVDVDDLPDTWQLVSIPLAQFAAPGAAYLKGFHLNFAQVPDCGLLVADPYLIGNTEPVWTERAAQRVDRQE